MNLCRLTRKFGRHFTVSKAKFCTVPTSGNSDRPSTGGTGKSSTSSPKLTGRIATVIQIAQDCPESVMSAAEFFNHSVKSPPRRIDIKPGAPNM